MAAYRRVYDSRHLQADCQEPGSAPETYATFAVANVARRPTKTTVKWKILGSQLGSRPCSNFANRLVVRLDEPPHYFAFW